MSINIFDAHADEMMMWHLCGIHECIRNSHSHMWTHVFSWEHSLPCLGTPIGPRWKHAFSHGTTYTNKLGNRHGNSKSHQLALRNTLWRWTCENEGLYEDVGLQYGGMVKWHTIHVKEMCEAIIGVAPQCMVKLQLYLGNLALKIKLKVICAIGDFNMHIILKNNRSHVQCCMMVMYTTSTNLDLGTSHFYIKCDPSWSIHMPYINITYLHIELLQCLPTYLKYLSTFANNMKTY
jgi:hypothetical protein